MSAVLKEWPAQLVRALGYNAQLDHCYRLSIRKPGEAQNEHEIGLTPAEAVEAALTILECEGLVVGTGDYVPAAYQATARVHLHDENSDYRTCRVLVIHDLRGDDHA